VDIPFFHKNFSGTFGKLYLFITKLSIGGKMKLTRNKIRRLIKEAITHRLLESTGDMPYRARIMLGLVSGVEVLPSNAVQEPWGSEDEQHRALYFALQDLGDVVMSGYDNNTGQVQLRPEKLQGGERFPYLIDKLNVAKSIVMTQPPYIIEQDVLLHFLMGLEPVLMAAAGGDPS
jgi:hypothetical protein